MTERETLDKLELKREDFDHHWTQMAEVLDGAPMNSLEDARLVSAFQGAKQRRVETELWASRARLTALMDTAPDAVFIVNGRTGSILSCNNQATILFGYTLKDLLEQPVEMIVEPDARELHARYRSGFMTSIRKRTLGSHPPIAARCKDGTLIELEIALTATPASDDVMVVCRPSTTACASVPSQTGSTMVA